MSRRDVHSDSLVSQNERPAYSFVSFLAEARGEDGFVDGEDDDHGYAAGDDCGDDVADRVRYAKCCGDRVPDAGEEVHDEEYSECACEVADQLLDDRSFAAEGYVSLQREVDAFTDDDRCEVCECEGEASVCEAVSDD